MTCDIVVLSPSETAFFAAGELVRCLGQMSEPIIHFHVRSDTKPADRGITLALAGDARITGRTGAITASAEDDAVAVDVRNGTGVICGSNQRSLLIGVYRLLHHLGCRWVRPGADGEYLPRRDIRQATATFVEQASVRHRVVCIEGAVSLQHVLDMIDWAPKVGFSGYFMQFPDGYVFFNRWYSHAGNPDLKPEPFSKEAARAFTVRIESEIRKRNLQYHAVGHGWTCQALGIDISHWDPIGVPLTEETRGMLAQVRGQRALQWDRPMITSLCFSQPQVRRRMVQSIVDHSLAHPNVDLLHVWLDDGGNNKCECEECSKSRPADLYVQMLHELDAALTAVSSPMRIVFISYSDLLWPPKEGTKPLNPQRFTFLYANARASYQQALTAQGAATMPDYVRNQTGNTQTPECFRGFLNAWKAFFPIGDHILFEYHLGGFRSNVLNQHDLARVIHADIAALKSLGFNGFISCQAQRVFFPTGLPCYAMGQTLWDNGQNLDVLRDDYFMAAFGQDGGACKEFLKVAAEILSQAVRFEDRVVLTAQAPMQLFKLEARVTEFERLLARNTAVTDLARARSWYYMGWYVRLLREFVALLGAMTTSKQDAVLASWQRFRSFLTSNEIHYHAVFDVPDFLGTLERYITEGRFSSLPQAVVQ